MRAYGPADAPDHRHRLLRARRDRPRCRCSTAHERDELAPPHELPSDEAHNLAHHWTISAPVHRSEIFPLMSVQGRVSRVSSVQTAMRNCTRDEGRSFEAGSQVLASNRCKLLSSKAMVVSVAVNVGRISRRVRLREASASEPPMNCRKPIRRCQNRGVTLPPGSARENPEACPSGIRHVGGAKLNQALVRNVRTCAPMQRERSQAAQTARIKVPMRSTGAEQPVVGTKAL
jgi:hypothetical protein